MLSPSKALQLPVKAIEIFSQIPKKRFASNCVSKFFKDSSLVPQAALPAKFFHDDSIM